MACHIYDWAKQRGYWLRPGQEVAPTHLLLDGGRLCVPDDSHAAFLNAYATSLVAHPGQPPCIVELRTPVFRMFVDLDTRFASREAAESAAALGAPMATALQRLAAAVLPGHPAALCLSSGVKHEERTDTWKVGAHLVWPEVLVAASTALALRRHALETLDDADLAAAGAAGTWADVIDAVVYRSSGLRMPWSAKGRHDPRVYELRARLDAHGALTAERVAGGVASLRHALRDLSVRAPGRSATLEARGEAGDEDDERPEGTQYVHKSLAAYASVLPQLAAALPKEFEGQRFTALLAGERCFMLRSTARHCFNVGRKHTSSNVYFVLTRRGVCQRCYCRRETVEGRQHGPCSDFASHPWPVPAEVVNAFFGEETASTTPGALATMPSRAGRSYNSFDNLVQRSRPGQKRARKGT